MKLFVSSNFPHLNYGEKDALDINVLVFAKREGRLTNSGVEPNAYKDMPEYKKLSKKKSSIPRASFNYGLLF